MKFFLRKLLFFSIGIIVPVILLAAGYFYYDPFKVLNKYSDYSNPDVVVNRDYISTEMFLRNYKTRKYNSFVFGSSRTLAYKPQSWKQFLSPGDNVFMFDASGETAYGILLKLRILDSLRVPVKNALIILCTDASFSSFKNPASHLFTKHYALTGTPSYRFHEIFLKAYLDPNFLFRFYIYKITGQKKSWMKGYIEEREISFDTITNEIRLLDYEKGLAANETLFYKTREKMFYQRDAEKEGEPLVVNQFAEIVKEISEILKRNKTDFRVVLSPLYDQKRWNRNDVEFLKSIFLNRVYDFSGKNSFTDDYRNYYETSHYRPIVGDSILKMIYRNNLDTGIVQK